MGDSFCGCYVLHQAMLAGHACLSVANSAPWPQNLQPSLEPCAVLETELVQAQQAGKQGLGKALPDCSRLAAAEVAALAASALLAKHREYSAFASPVVPGAVVHEGEDMPRVDEATPGPESRLLTARDSSR